MSAGTTEDTSAGGVVELREDIPLKPSAATGGAGRYFSGIRFVIGCFAVLTAAVTVALATQIYYGDYELVPHGSVASDAASCSRAGTDALKSGGGALDAAVAAALCLAVLSPHTTGADAAGTLMYYGYRSGRAQGPEVTDWSRVPRPAGAERVEGAAGAAPPRLVAALAALHRRYGKLPWRQLVEPAEQLASSGFPVSSGLAAATRRGGAAGALGELQPGQTLKLAALAGYLRRLANATREELEAMAAAFPLTSEPALRAELGGLVLYTPAAAVAPVAALRQLMGSAMSGGAHPPDDHLLSRTASGLQQALRAGAGAAAAGAGSSASTNVAVIDKDDVYVSLVTGLSAPFGSRKMTPEGYFPDPAPAPALTPLILTENYTCGYRYVLGSGDVSALTQVAARLLTGERDLIASVERPRFSILPDSSIGLEVEHTQRTFTAAELRELRSVGALRNLTAPYAGCNVVQQRGDALSSHADSRGGGIAYRF